MVQVMRRWKPSESPAINFFEAKWKRKLLASRIAVLSQRMPGSWIFVQ